jgi:hypothetical protein
MARSITEADAKSWQQGMVAACAQGACLVLLSLFVVSCTQDISLDEMLPIQAIFDPVPLVLYKRTTMQLRITSTFPADQQIVVQLAKNDGSGVFALLTDETGQHVQFATARTHLLVHPGSHTYYWPPAFAPLIDFPTANLNDILPDGNPWCVTMMLDAGPSDSNSANNTATLCFAAKEANPLPTLIVPVGSTTCDDLARFEDQWHDLFLGAYPIPEFPRFRGVQIENGRDLSTKRCPEMVPPIPLPSITSDAGVTDFLHQLDGLRIGTDFTHVIGVTRTNFYLPYGGPVDGFSEFSGNDKGVWIAENLDNFAATGLHEIAHTFGWVTSSAPHACPGNHLCDVPAPGYWVARDASIAENVIDFMDPVNSRAFQWISSETYDFLLNALKVGPDPIITEVRAVIHNDGTVDLEPWFQFKAQPDVALDNRGNLVFRYLNDRGRELARTGTNFAPARLSNGTVLDRGYISLRIPTVPGTARIQATLNGTPIFERDVSPYIPTVRLVNPQPGLIVNPGDRIGVDWEGADRDGGNHLTYAVFVRRDGNSPWIPLAVGSTDTHLDYVVPADFPSGPAILRVMATDGINTGEATSH